MQTIYDLCVQQDGFEVFAKGAKHATNLFTVEAKHANFLGCLGQIFLISLMESDGLPSHVCRS